MVEYIKKSISKLMDDVQKVEDAEFSKIVPALLKKGVDNIDLSMFGDVDKSDLLNRAGDELFKRGNYPEAIRAYKAADEFQRLLQVGELCMQKDKLDFAIEIFNILNNREKLISIGDKCLKEGQYLYASHAYEL